MYIRRRISYCYNELISPWVDMSYKLEWGKQSIFINYEGDLSINELLEVGNKIINDSRYVFVESVISDFIKVTHFNLSKMDIKGMSTLHVIPSILNPNLKFAIVFNNSDLQESILHYTDLMKVNEWEIKSFAKLEEALKWCNQK